MGSLRREVLSCFKKLHRTRRAVFDGDGFALQDSRQKVNEEFRKNRHVTDATVVSQLIQHGRDVEHELRTTVIQAKEVKPGVYEAKITPDTVRLDNTPYMDPCPNQDANQSRK